MKVLKYTGFVYIALVAVFSAYLVSNIVGYYFAAPHPVVLSGTSGTPSAETLRSQMVISITERNLFNIDKVPEVIADPNANGAVPAASFSGKLTGVIVAQDVADSRAIILLNNKDVYALRVGIEQDGYMLKSVTYDSAVVLTGGGEYNLVLDPGGTPGSVANIPNVTRPVNPPPQAITPPPQSVSSGGTEQHTLERGELMDQLKDINTVLRSLLVSPLYNDGEFAGYRVARMNDDSPMRSLGLLPGDVINRLNGEELTNPELLFSMLSKLDEISAVSIDITRGGEKKTLFVEIQ